MKDKPIKNCLGLDCPDKICRKCQVGNCVINGWDTKYICSHCSKEFVGNPCTAGEREDWEEKILELPDFPNKEDLPLVHRNVAISFMRNLLKSEKEKWQKEQSGWNELKQCKQCFTMKAFTTEVCFRCTERNDIREELIKEIDALKKNPLANENDRYNLAIEDIINKLKE